MILVIDDDIAVRTSLKLLLTEHGHKVHLVDGPAPALEWLRRNQPSLILMDMNFSNATSGHEGLELQQKVKIFHPEVPVILITGWGSIDLAVEGIKQGARDFITKPWNNEQLLRSIETHLSLKETEQQQELPRQQLERKYDFSAIIGKDSSLIELLNQIAKIAPTNAPVLITGESGTGKELVAEAIHKNSHRAGKAFVKVNLGGISTSLFESEMFGHKKGAFTDAREDRDGRFAMADGGTIFLDEIGELPLSAQVKLLRVLQEHSYEVLGDSRSRQTDVRVICATNKNLPELIREGQFREDLYYRINLINLTVPSLRERPNDIPLLANYFIRQVCWNHKISEQTIEHAALEKLKSYAFPGNVRELKNICEGLALLNTGEKTISEEKTAEHLQKNNSPSQALSAGGLQTLDKMERKAILETLEFFKGNVSRAARSLGLSRGALYRRIEKHDIPGNYLDRSS